MQFKAIIVALFASAVAAQGAICFDDGDCLIQGGGSCTRSGISIIGNCVGGGSGFALPSGLSLPSFGRREAEADAEAVAEPEASS